MDVAFFFFFFNSHVANILKKLPVYERKFEKVKEYQWAGEHWKKKWRANGIMEEFGFILDLGT